MKFESKVGLVIISLALTACTSTIYPTDIETGVKVCEPNGGVARYLVEIGYVKVVCKNGLKSGWLDDMTQRLPDTARSPQ